MIENAERDPGKPRLRQRALVSLFVSLLFAGIGLAGCSPGDEDTAKPNVVVVMTDDQWFESLEFMPHTKRLVADQGVSFDRYYASTPLCCPSRATFLSGQFAHNNGVRHNSAPSGGYGKLDERDTLPVWLRRAGYATSHIGKYPNGYGVQDARHVPPGWDEWRGSVDPSTYYMWGYRLNENGVLRKYGKPRDEDPRLYQTDVYRKKGVDFITRKARAGKPFFLSLAFLAPHQEDPGMTSTRSATIEPHIGPAPRPAPRHEGRFAGKPLPRTPSRAETDLRDKPEFLREYAPIDRRTRRAITASYQGRLASLQAVDEAVAKLVRTLEEVDELDNTHLIFASDNGFFFGEHRVPTGKFLPHDASAHVPMLIRGPGIPAGQRSDELTSNADLTATIARITGARPSVPLDGRSMLPFARDPRLRTDRPLLHEAADGALPTPVRRAKHSAPTDDRTAGRSASAGDLDQDPAAPTASAKPRRHGQVYSAGYEAIRTRRYLYVRYVMGDRELYDLARDPHELVSRHADPRYTRIREFLDRRLDTLQRCAGQGCRREIAPARRPG